jgi:hypothetical protein
MTTTVNFPATSENLYHIIRHHRPQKCILHSLCCQHHNNNTWKQWAARSLETQTTFCQTTRCYILEENYIQPYLSSNTSVEADGSCSLSCGLNSSLNLMTSLTRGRDKNIGTICRSSQQRSCDTPISDDRACCDPSPVVFVRMICLQEMYVVYIRVSWAKRTTEYPMPSYSCSAIVQNHNLIWLPFIPQRHYRYKNRIILHKADPDSHAV